MDQNIQIQLPNPQQHIVNSAAYQQAGSSTGSSFNVRNILFGVGALTIVGGVGWGALSVKRAMDSYSDAVQERSDAISQILEADQEDSFGIIGKAQAKYDNPFEEEGSYENPFEEENPFE